MAAVATHAAAAATAHPSFPELDSSYDVGKRLGRGCFATVYKARRRSDDAAVAVKAVEKKRLDVETAKLLQNELEVLQAVSEHPGIVTLLDSVETDTYMFFVMAYVDGGPLLDRIVSKGNFSENDARVILRTILQTLHYLSHLGCVHRDIKPENILVDNHSKSWPVKLTDFGLSAKMQPDELLHGTLGTPLFVAPEILKGEGYDCACDTWSLGVVLYLVLCGYPPFPYDNAKELVRAIVHGRYSFPAPEWDHVSSDAKDALTRMMEVDPKRRITPADALRHPWFRAAQSTTDLPNSKLVSFNARRKLRAGMFAVRTTFDFMKFVNKDRSSSQKEGPSTQEELLQAVEKSRKLIQRMGISGRSSPPSQTNNAQREQPDVELTRPMSRRSLVLPSSILESASLYTPKVTHVTEGGMPAERTSREFAHRSSDIIPWSSQMMSSRAKALVAEVKGSPVLDDSENPFFVIQQPRREEQNETAQDQQPPSSESRDSSGDPVAMAPGDEPDLCEERQQQPSSAERSETERVPRPLVQLDFERHGIL